MVENTFEISREKAEQSTINLSEDRKKRTELFLKEQGIPFNPHLPPIQSETDVNMKTPEEIVKRAVCAFLTANIGCDVAQSDNILDSVEFFYGILKKFELENELTSDEKQLFNYDGSYKLDEKYIAEMTWRMERCMPLFWVCGFIDGELDYPDNASNTEFMIPIIMESKDFSSLMKKVTMKDSSEILDNADVIYRMDWACVDARIKGMSSPADLDAEVVVEQHKGFNWIIGAYASDDWDNISADT